MRRSSGERSDYSWPAAAVVRPFLHSLIVAAVPSVSEIATPQNPPFVRLDRRRDVDRSSVAIGLRSPSRPLKKRRFRSCLLSPSSASVIRAPAAGPNADPQRCFLSSASLRRLQRLSIGPVRHRIVLLPVSSRRIYATL